MSSSIYDRLAELPVPTSGRFLGQNVIQLNSSVLDLTRKTKRSVSKSFFLTAESVFSSENQETSETVLSRPSKSGKYRANLKEIEKKRFLEVWSNERLVAIKEVTDVHGAFYNDDYLSTLSFSETEDILVYVAEEKNESPKDTPEHFQYRQTLGEGFGGKRQPAVFLYLWKKNKVVRLSTNAPNVLLGQLIFSSQSGTLFATGYEYSFGGRLLGVKGCYNRPSGIWRITFDQGAVDKAADDESDTSIEGTLKKITPHDLSCRSPRLLSSNGSERLLWLSCASGGAHAATSRLHSLDITNGVDQEKSKVVVDIVDDNKDGQFPGFYPDASLPQSPFLRIGGRDYLISHSMYHSTNVILLISLDDGTVTNLTSAESDLLLNWTVLNTDNERRVLCARSSAVVPYEVVLGEFDDAGKVSWRVIQTSLSQLSEDLQKRLGELQVSTIRIPNRHPVETVVIQHAKSEKTPSHILMPHGGPHATSTVAFNAATSAFALEGFNISLPNYTGSLGFGESHVKQLIGKCGTLDVEECYESLQHLIKLGVVEKTSKVFLFGGSHGGFLIGHLLARYPKAFAAGCLRNPVTSSGEVSTSDIRDWYWAEFNHEYPLFSSPIGSDGRDEPSPPSDLGVMVPGRYKALFELSPMAHVDKVEAAVLLSIGGSDRRVAPTQGVDYYHALKASRTKKGLKGDDVEMLWFPEDSHPLEGVDAGRMTWVRSLELFNKS